EAESARFVESNPYWTRLSVGRLVRQRIVTPVGVPICRYGPRVSVGNTGGGSPIRAVSVNAKLRLALVGELKWTSTASTFVPSLRAFRLIVREMKNCSPGSGGPAGSASVAASTVPVGIKLR